MIKIETFVVCVVYYLKLHGPDWVNTSAKITIIGMLVGFWLSNSTKDLILKSCHSEPFFLTLTAY